MTSELMRGDCVLFRRSGVWTDTAGMHEFSVWLIDESGMSRTISVYERPYWLLKTYDTALVDMEVAGMHVKVYRVMDVGEKGCVFWDWVTTKVMRDLWKDAVGGKVTFFVDLPDVMATIPTVVTDLWE